MSDALKFDDGKLRFDLIPHEVLTALAEILTSGAAKYGERSWETGIIDSRIHAALMRHLVRWQSGELLDPDSGLSHMKHVLCNAAFLVTFEARKVGTDDRPKRQHPMMTMQDGATAQAV